jgi:hypothetical protein
MSSDARRRAGRALLCIARVWGEALRLPLSSATNTAKVPLRDTYFQWSRDYAHMGLNGFLAWAWLLDR